MSLGPTCVLCDDGNFYKDPVPFGSDWFLCFDEDDPPELVIQKFRDRTPTDCYRRAEQVIQEIGLSAEITAVHQKAGSRVFPPARRTREACAYWLKITAPVPVSILPAARQPMTERLLNCSYEMCGGTHEWFPMQRTALR